MQLVDGINGNVNSQNESSKEGADPEGRNNRYPALEEEENLFLDQVDRRPCKEQAIISHNFLEQRLRDNYTNLYIKYGLRSKKKNATVALEYLVFPLS